MCSQILPPDMSSVNLVCIQIESDVVLSMDTRSGPAIDLSWLIEQLQSATTHKKIDLEHNEVYLRKCKGL